MTAPQPPQQPSTRFLVAFTAALIAIVATVGLLALYVVERPFSEAPSRPLPASTAPPAPLTVELTATPLHGWGPR